MANHEVGVEVREDHMLDREPEAGSIGQVVVHVTAGIDHGRHARALVTDEVRRLRQAPKIVLLENHRGTCIFQEEQWECQVSLGIAVGEALS